MQEIKDCPICKCGASLRFLGRSAALLYIVECDIEPDRHYSGFGKSKDTAIGEWNKWVDANTQPTHSTRIQHTLNTQDEPTQATTRREILDEAAKCVCGDRENEYGSPEDNFKLIAALWGDYLHWEITPVDVAMMMTMLKIARIKTGVMTRDSFVDAAGYIACGGEIAARMEGDNT